MSPCPTGLYLWMSPYVDGEFVDGDTGAIVQDLDDATIEQAAREWYADRMGALSPGDSP